MKQLYIIKMAFSALLLLSAMTVTATETNDTTETYANQTVSSEVVLHPQHPLTMNNVTVTPTGKLTAIALEGVTITNGLDVRLGGTLNLYGDQQLRIRYLYDSSGNRIRREKNTNNN